MRFLVIYVTLLITIYLKQKPKPTARVSLNSETFLIKLLWIKLIL